MRAWSVGLVLVGAACAAPVALAGQGEDGAEAAVHLLLDVGTSAIHGDRGEDGVVGRAGLLWPLDRQRVLRIGGHVAVATADENYVTVGPAAELRPLTGARLSPYLAARAGVLAEPEFAGGFLAAGLGLELRLPGAGVRVELSRGFHGAGSDGPAELTGGVRIPL